MSNSLLRVLPGAFLCCLLSASCAAEEPSESSEANSVTGSSLRAAHCPGSTTEFPLTPVVANGLTFNVRVAGPEGGEAVLLLHGFPEGSYEWRFQMRALVNAGYRVIAPDQRGYSPGARPTNVQDYAIPNLVIDALGIADAFGVERFHLVAHDWGAAVAWGLAQFVPQRVRSLTSLSVPAPGALGHELDDKTSCQYQVSSYFGLFTPPNAEDKFLFLNGVGLRFLYAELQSDARCEYLSALNNKPALNAAFNWYRANTDGRKLVGTTDFPVTVPTMLLWGDRDSFFCRETVDLTAQFVNAPYRLEVLEHEGHWLPELDSDRVSSLILEHLASTRGQ